MVGVKVIGASKTAFGKFPNQTTLGLQTEAATKAMHDAGVGAPDIDAVITGYSTVSNHLMPANLIAERLGIRPRTALGLSIGGATGLAMLANAYALIQSGSADTVLVVAGENRATGQSSSKSSEVLAQVAEQDYEVPLGSTVPSYYALLASQYQHRYSLAEGSLSGISVQMRQHASRTHGAHFTKPITTEDVLASPIVAEPLHLLECCPVSDGGAAIIVCRDDVSLAKDGVSVLGLGSANKHQHVSEMNFDDIGAETSAGQALEMAGISLKTIDVFGVYDSFTITLAMILEEIGLTKPGQTAQAAMAGEFSQNGSMPLNLHGGLLSYGHSGVAGGLAHVVEVVDQILARAGDRQVTNARFGYVHGDGGVMSAHVAAVMGIKE